MSSIFGIVGPVFITILLGYLAQRTGRISAEGLRGLNDFVLLLALPALLFEVAASNQGLGSTMAVSVAYFGAAVPVYLLTMVAGWKLRRLRLQEASLFGLDASYGNLGMVGIPVVLAAFGEEGLHNLLAILAFHSIVMLPIATVIAEVGINRDAPPLQIFRSAFASLLRNPVVLAVASGGAWSLLMPPLPDLLHNLLRLLGSAMSPVALFCLGAGLTGFNLRRDWPDAALGTAIKLLLLPVVVWAVARLLGLPPLSTAVVVTAAAMPTGANAFILSRRYGVGMNRSGATVLMGSALSVVTLSLVIALFVR